MNCKYIPYHVNILKYTPSFYESIPSPCLIPHLLSSDVITVFHRVILQIK